MLREVTFQLNFKNIHAQVANSVFVWNDRKSDAILESPPHGENLTFKGVSYQFKDFNIHFWKIS